MALLVYLGVSGRTGSWPETACTISDSRVVRVEMPTRLYLQPILAYEGEYQLRYRVAGRDYFMRVKSGWIDANRDFVESKVSSYDPNDPSQCIYRVHYNPANPKEAFAKSR